MDHSSRARPVRTPHRSPGVCPFPGHRPRGGPAHARSTARVPPTTDVPQHLATLLTSSHTHYVSASAARRLPISMSIPARPAPPPCALSALPPPLPVTALANSGTSLPAVRPFSWAAEVVATTKLTFPSD